MVQPPHTCPSPGGLSCGPPPPRPAVRQVWLPHAYLSYLLCRSFSICGRTVVHRSSFHRELGRGPGTRALSTWPCPRPPPPIPRHGHSRLLVDNVKEVYDHRQVIDGHGWKAIKEPIWEEGSPGQAAGVAPSGDHAPRRPHPAAWTDGRTQPHSSGASVQHLSQGQTRPIHPRTALQG